MKKIAFAFAFAAFVSCTSTEEEPEGSSSGGNNDGDSSSSIGSGDGDSSSGGGDGNSSSGGGDGNSSSSVGGDGNSSSSNVSGGNSSSSVGGGNSSSSVGGGNSSSSGGGNSSSSSGGGNSSSSGGSSPNLWTGFPFDNSNENLPASPNCPNPDKAIEITYNNGGAPEINNPYENTVSVEKNGENVIVNLQSSGQEERNLRLSGTARDGSLKVRGYLSRVMLYMNGVNITKNSGPAINIQDGRRVTVCLVSGKENYLNGTSAAPQGDEQAKGAFFSEEKLYFTGNGSLEVKARSSGDPNRNDHAIVVDNDFEIDNGKIIISEAAGDGIHANDKIEIKGGVIKIASKGDAIQSERFGTQIDPSVVISGGKILAKTTGVKSHGITSESPISIKNNAIVQISVEGNGSKGIKSTRWAEIFGGTIKIKTSGDRDGNDADSSTAAGIKVGNDDNLFDLFIEGGSITIQSTGSKAKGINVSNDIDMKGGNVDIEAEDDGIKVHGALKIKGGSISVSSRRSDDIDGEVTQTGGTINGQSNYKK